VYRGNVAGILLLLPLVGLSVTQTSRPLTDLGMAVPQVSFLPGGVSSITITLLFLSSFCLFTENIAGKLVFYQMEGNATRVRATGELASDVPTETTFELFDPQKNFSTAKFTYTWDLGNGYEGVSRFDHIFFLKVGCFSFTSSVDAER